MNVTTRTRSILAVGTRRGVVELYDLVESGLLIRTVSLYDWGYVLHLLITLESWWCNAMFLCLVLKRELNNVFVLKARL